MAKKWKADITGDKTIQYITPSRLLQSMGIPQTAIVIHGNEPAKRGHRLVEGDIITIRYISKPD